MTTPAPPQSVKARDAGHIGGEKIIANVIAGRFVWTDTVSTRNFSAFLHGSFSAAFSLTPAVVTAIFSAQLASWVTHCAPFAPTTILFAALGMRDMSPPGHHAEVVQTVGGAPGTSPSAVLPHELAIVFTKRTASAGRGFRGRMYIPGWAANADSGDGLIDAALRTAMNLWAVDLLAAYTANGLTPCIAQPERLEHLGTTGSLIPHRPAGFVPLTSMTVRDLNWDSQRRRGQI